MLEPDELLASAATLEELRKGFGHLPPFTQLSAVSDAEIASVLQQVASRLCKERPYFHPLYAGQMLKPPHQVAQLAYSLAMRFNCNNHAADGGRATSEMEVEAVAEIAAMFGWERHLGHLCGGGTMANLEALWVARSLRPGAMIVASENAHYTHERLCEVLGAPFESIACDQRGRMDLQALSRRLAAGDVGTVVATLGTTALGAVDPLAEIAEIAQTDGVRVHADAAYGGYFRLASNLENDAERAFAALGEADSIVVDPHKHGLQPYGCGCILFRDSTVGRFYQHDSPYTYFSSAALHLGEISLECSRAGAAAAALWATQKLLPLKRGGTFASMLESCHNAAGRLFEVLRADDRFLCPIRPELDVVVWGVAADSIRESSALARRIFEEAERRGLFLALVDLPTTLFRDVDSGLRLDQSKMTCLRSVLMKPEHEQWIDDLWRRLSDAVDAVLGDAQRADGG